MTYYEQSLTVGGSISHELTSGFGSKAEFVYQASVALRPFRSAVANLFELFGRQNHHRLHHDVTGCFFSGVGTF